MHFKSLLILFLIVISPLINYSQVNEILPGDYDTMAYISKLKNKKVGVVANQASLINGKHFVDTLLSAGINVIKIYSPEHGFRGQAENGELISNEKDPQTGIQVISIYGKNKKPSVKDLEGIDIMLFDLQDVGVRFYTYISTLHYIMESCAENGIPVIILDRPNPNGFYIDGPVLDMKFTSFVGMHPVPVVYGMTIGEYGLMINGEKWMNDKITCNLEVVKCSNYDHNSLYPLPVRPSPNLPDMASVYLYPSLCFFEGTIVSVGRGTEHPFSCYGHPDFFIGSLGFIPRSIPGVSLNPKLMDQECFGQWLGNSYTLILTEKKLNLTWLLETYKVLSVKHDFFIPYFEKLAGTDKLREQIESGMNEDQIRMTWKGDIEKFKKIRKNYLLYSDFN